MTLAASVTPAQGQTQAGQLIISEFRLHGPGGANDEYGEVYNTTSSSHTVTSASGSGLGIAASDGTLRCTVPNGTVIPAHGHFLCANTGASGDSLSSYPAGNNGASATTATPNATYATDITNNVGIALFNNDSSFALANRLEAVGPATEANPTYKEGTGYTAVATAAVNFAIARRLEVPGGKALDTGNNATDFRTVAVNANASLPTASLGAPGPENLTARSPSAAG